MLIDAHVHLFPPRFRERREDLLRLDSTFKDLYTNPAVKMATVEDLIPAMDAAGVDLTVAAGIGWQNLELAREANNYLLKVQSLFPQRLVGLCSVNPASGDAALTEVERCLQAGLKGVGELHPDTQGYHLGDHDVVAPLMEMVAQYDVPVLIHSSEPVGHNYPGKGKVTPEVLLRFIQDFPKTTIVCAHWGGGLPFYALMPEVASSLTKVYFDSAASPFLYNSSVFSLVAELVGPEKLLFATDFPLIQPQRLLAQVRESRLSPEVQSLILGGNAARLMNL